jgi:predicted DNA-binding protein (MmcQ/YjbR family)
MAKPTPKKADPGADNSERIRSICLAYPEASEKSSWAHPNFLAGSRTFVTLETHADRPCVAIRLAADYVRELCESRNFFPTPYGKGQWASCYIDDRVNWRLLSRLIDDSYRQVALQRMLKILDARSTGKVT